jgi:dolichol-phosphate mannosyltransferase
MEPPLARLGRLRRFASVGVLGLAVNVGTQVALTELAGLHYLVAAVLATQVSSTTNFAGSEWWAFRAERQSGLPARFLAFLALNNVAFLVRGPIIWALTEGVGLFHGVSNLVSLVALTLIRFHVADRLIWRSTSEPGLGDLGLANAET